MCRHCERLVEDIEDKELVHNFMAKTAEKVNRKIGPLHYKPITADDIDIKIEIRAQSRNNVFDILKEMYE